MMALHFSEVKMYKEVKTGSKITSKASFHSSGINTVGYCTGTEKSLQISIYKTLQGHLGVSPHFLIVEITILVFQHM